jgi:hypothetical protein
MAKTLNLGPQGEPILSLRELPKRANKTTLTARVVAQYRRLYGREWRKIRSEK